MPEAFRGSKVAVQSDKMLGSREAGNLLCLHRPELALYSFDSFTS